MCARSCSTMCLPITYKCCEEVLKLPKAVTRYQLPIGASINPDGLALYEAAASIFILQLNQLPIPIGTFIALYVVITLAAVGAAASPTSSIVTVGIIMNSYGLPGKDIALLFGIDWLVYALSLVLMCLFKYSTCVHCVRSVAK